METALNDAVDLRALLARAEELFGDPDPEKEYDLLEFIAGGQLFRIHNYETMGDRPVGTIDCGSVKLDDTPKALYRAMFLFRPDAMCFKDMYKNALLTLVSPDYQLVASLEFFKYELAVYFSASPEHVEGKGSSVISGLPGSHNGIRFKGEIARAWFGLIPRLLNREWDVYAGNNFTV